MGRGHAVTGLAGKNHALREQRGTRPAVSGNALLVHWNLIGRPRRS